MSKVGSVSGDPLVASPVSMTKSANGSIMAGSEGVDGAGSIPSRRGQGHDVGLRHEDWGWSSPPWKNISS